MKSISLSRRIGLAVTLSMLLSMTLFFLESTRGIYHRQLTEHLDELEELAHRFNQDLSSYLAHMVAIESNGNIHKEERIQEIHALLQPLVEKHVERNQLSSLGYYSHTLDSIVAITPFNELENLIGHPLDEDHPSSLLYTESPIQREVNHVLRGKVARYAMVVFWNGEPIGHLWANLPVGVFYKSILPSLLLFLFLAIIGVGFGRLLSIYLYRSILSATKALENRLDSLSHEAMDDSLFHKDEKRVPLEFQSLYRRFAQSFKKIQNLTVELTISTRLAALGDLVTVVAHDIRNPLSLIMARAQLGAKSTCEEKSQKYFEGILDASRIMDQFLERILLLAKVDTVKKRRFSIHRVLTELIELWAPLLRKKNILFEASIEEDLPRVMGDPVGFQQAFLNLFKNAIEATSTGGSIKVEAFYKDGGVSISISDTGEGIPEEVQGQIFNRFFTTKDSKGSGIGLAMAHSVITGEGGRLWFETARGEGTTFFIQLPVDSLSQELGREGQEDCSLKDLSKDDIILSEEKTTIARDYLREGVS